MQELEAAMMLGFSSEKVVFRKDTKMKITKPIVTRSGFPTTALITLKEIRINMLEATCLLRIAVYKDVDSEDLGVIKDPPFALMYVIDDNGEVPLFTNQVIPALQGQNMMARIRAFIKNQIGGDDFVDIDSD